MRISLYTTPNCPQCRISKKMLDEAHVKYDLIDLTQNAEAMSRVTELGYSAAPVVITENNHWSGFRYEKLLSAITKYRSDNTPRVA